MELFLDALVLLLWISFFVATAAGIVHEIRRGREKSVVGARSAAPLHDDDPVYLMGPLVRE